MVDRSTILTGLLRSIAFRKLYFAAMRVTVIASGSKGNCLVVESGQTRIAVDAGFGPRILAKKLRASGIEPQSIEACVITHEHLDHSSGAMKARKKFHWTLAATPPTLQAIGAPDSAAAARLAPIDYGCTHTFGDARVTLAKISHDAVSPAAVLVEDNNSGTRLGIVYDLGFAPESLAKTFSDLDILVVEANHDPEMLRTGPYPPHLQARISSARGHLSNNQAADFIRRVMHRGLRTIILAHLSEHNNTPLVARETIGRMLRRTIFRGKLGAASQNSACAVGHERDVQLRLGV